MNKEGSLLFFLFVLLFCDGVVGDFGWCERGLEMGILSTILGFWGFGVGTSIGLVIGYYMFIYFQPTDVKVSVSLPFILFRRQFKFVQSDFGFPEATLCSIWLNCSLSVVFILARR